MIDAIIVLGMHRSGTSCLTGCLKNFGLNLGEVSNFNKHNLKGNQENRKIFQLNEAIFQYNNGSWQHPPKTLLWNEELTMQQQTILNKYNELEKPFGIKDPRMLFAYPFWQDKLPKHAFVGTFRHPKAVALSLRTRKNVKLNLPLYQGYKLWGLYNEKLIHYYKVKRFPIINFDISPSNYLAQMQLVAEELGLRTVHNKESFFDLNLKNQKNYKLSDCPEHLKPLYKKLLSLR